MSNLLVAAMLAARKAQGELHDLVESRVGKGWALRVGDTEYGSIRAWLSSTEKHTGYTPEKLIEVRSALGAKTAWISNEGLITLLFDDPNDPEHAKP